MITTFFCYAKGFKTFCGFLVKDEEGYKCSHCNKRFTPLEVLEMQLKKNTNRIAKSLIEIARLEAINGKLPKMFESEYYDEAQRLIAKDVGVLEKRINAFLKNNEDLKEYFEQLY